MFKENKDNEMLQYNDMEDYDSFVKMRWQDQRTVNYVTWCPTETIELRLLLSSCSN